MFAEEVPEVLKASGTKKGKPRGWDSQEWRGALPVASTIPSDGPTCADPPLGALENLPPVRMPRLQFACVERCNLFGIQRKAIGDFNRRVQGTSQ